MADGRTAAGGVGAAVAPGDGVGDEHGQGPGRDSKEYADIHHEYSAVAEAAREAAQALEEVARDHRDARFLVQGTLYPDVIESVSVRGPSATIKTHHNVGGLPEELGFELIEPFRELFKDEVRDVGRALGSLGGSICPPYPRDRPSSARAR